MFWAFVLAVALAAVFVKLGAYSVWMGILAVALKVDLLVIAGLSVGLLWRRAVARNKGADA